MFLAELLGTMTLIVLGDGVVANVLLSKTKGQNSGWIVITAGWGLAVMAGAYVSAALGGPGSLNPAGILSAVAAGGMQIDLAAQAIGGEFVGAILGAVLVYILYLPHWAETTDAGLKLAVFSTGPAIRNPASNFVTEVIATFMLIIIASAVFSKSVGIGDSKGLGQWAIGAVIWGLGLSVGGPTGYALNPARDLGPRIAHAFLPIPGKGSSDWGYAWIPVFGPIVGACAAALLWKAIAPV